MRVDDDMTPWEVMDVRPPDTQIHEIVKAPDSANDAFSKERMGRAFRPWGLRLQPQPRLASRHEKPHSRSNQGIRCGF
jgi:hypothetical protein